MDFVVRDSKMTTALLTGCCGFVGSHICERILADTDWEIIGIDSYNYAGRMDNLAHLDQSRIRVVYRDISESFVAPLDYTSVDYVIHNAASSHVAHSLVDPAEFVSSNIMGTFNVLELSRFLKPKKFLYTSTDEVFGSSLMPHDESDALNPSNPYSATKAAAEYLVRAWGRSFDVPYIITRSSNLFGKRQHCEKFIPMTIQKILNHEIVNIHAGNLNKPQFQIGTRQWLHASDQARAILFLLTSPYENDTFHIGGMRQTNKQIAEIISEKMQKTLYQKYVEVTTLYPGHDLDYTISDRKIKEAGWSPTLSFEEGIDLTVR